MSQKQELVLFLMFWGHYLHFFYKKIKIEQSLTLIEQSGMLKYSNITVSSQA